MFVLFIVYVVVEIAALVAVASAIGVMWTVLLILVGSIVGLVLVRSQGKRVMAEFRAASRGERSPGVAVADGALFTIGSIALFAPGLVTSVIGILLLLPFTRWALRPLVVVGAARWMPTVVSGRSTNAPTVIDGEVVSDQERSPAGDAAHARIIDMNGQDFDKPAR